MFYINYKRVNTSQYLKNDNKRSFDPVSRLELALKKILMNQLTHCEYNICTTELKTLLKH